MMAVGARDAIISSALSAREDGLPVIGLIGFGAIGRDLCGRLRAEGFAVVVLLREGSSAAALVPPDVTGVATLEALLAAGPLLVVEAASQDVVSAMVPGLLEAGIRVVVASVGALADADLLRRLTVAAETGGTRLITPAGALGGLDYLAALHNAEGARVRYTSRKPPRAWTEELAALGHAAHGLTTEVLLFEGQAADAARRYPKNLNAGLTVALAAGQAITRVRVIADPNVTLNTHEIEVESALGTAFMRFANRPSTDNPKTSAITAASLLVATRREFARVVR